MEFERVTRLSVPEEIIENVKEKIISGELKPGDHLPAETKLAEMFGVGRGTVREAMKVMFYLGLIDRNNSRNTFITETAREKAIMRSFLDRFEGHRDAMEMIELRKILEPEAAAIAAERQEDHIIEKLEKEYKIMQENLDDLEKFIDADGRFHQHIFGGTGNSLIIELMQSVNMALKKEQSIVLHGSRTIKPKSLSFHKNLLNAIKTGDSKQSRKIMLEHILDIEAEMYDMYKKRA
ncbi:MAG: FCD domain-containing protein [Spirochaetales bacterium]|uniref:FCD domain-containing protein n=1 Tax=Candidatus Thalassospirochaeta sargassi TaxID=3119039 RepID=A0AAJ1IGS9_9SPIO|nr:FCD domain-containing protein [Spirochaetales bacterium]